MGVPPRDPLLATKLYIPPLSPNLVPRPRLIQRLDEELRLGHRLTLVSGPAGFGKTTVLSEWLAGCACPAAWVSLDLSFDIDTQSCYHKKTCGGWCLQRGQP